MTLHDTAFFQREFKSCQNIWYKVEYQKKKKKVVIKKQQ